MRSIVIKIVCDPNHDTAAWRSGDLLSSLNASVASGGNWIRIECSRPIHSRASLCMPPKFPTLLPLMTSKMAVAALVL